MLRNILPVPMQFDKLYDIIDFKRHHSKQLVRFRNYIESFLIDLEAIPIDFRQERIDLFVREAKDEIADLSNKMTVLGSISCASLFSVGSASITLGKGVATSDGADILLGATGLIGALSTVFNIARHSEIKRHPLAYALSANEII